MNISINENSKLLRFYSVLSFVLGGLLLFWGGVLLCRILLLFRLWQAKPIITAVVAAENLHQSVYQFVIPGIVVLWIGQFIKYITKQISKPTWILRFGVKIFYVFILFIIFDPIICIWLFALINSGQFIAPQGASAIPSAGSPFLAWAGFIFSQLLLGIVYIFILFGLAQVLKRIMPVIEESRTLV